MSAPPRCLSTDRWIAPRKPRTFMDESLLGKGWKEVGQTTKVGDSEISVIEILPTRAMGISWPLDVSAAQWHGLTRISFVEATLGTDFLCNLPAQGDRNGICPASRNKYGLNSRPFLVVIRTALYFLYFLYCVLYTHWHTCKLAQRCCNFKVLDTVHTLRWSWMVCQIQLDMKRHGRLQRKLPCCVLNTLNTGSCNKPKMSFALFPI